MLLSLPLGCSKCDNCKTNTGISQTKGASSGQGKLMRDGAEDVLLEDQECKKMVDEAKILVVFNSWTNATVRMPGRTDAILRGDSVQAILEDLGNVLGGDGMSNDYVVVVFPSRNIVSPSNPLTVEVLSKIQECAYSNGVSHLWFLSTRHGLFHRCYSDGLPTSAEVEKMRVEANQFYRAAEGFEGPALKTTNRPSAPDQPSR